MDNEWSNNNKMTKELEQEMTRVIVMLIGLTVLSALFYSLIIFGIIKLILWII